MAGGTWDKLEQVFEDRVARALSKLGVYTQNDVQKLARSRRCAVGRGERAAESDGRVGESARKTARQEGSEEATRGAERYLQEVTRGDPQVVRASGNAGATPEKLQAAAALPCKRPGRTLPDTRRSLTRG